MNGTKAVILAGGLGTRIAEESDLRPKPLIEIGGKPILWHIMKIFSHYDVREFYVCLGYKGHMIKEYFVNYFMRASNITVDTATGAVEYHDSEGVAEPWRVSLIDTGRDTMTGGRLARLRPYLAGDEPFLFTYGDGVADIDIGDLMAFHRAHGKRATVTAVTPPGRYGALDLEGDAVQRFIEKPPGDNSLINGGFFALHPSTIDLIPGDESVWEHGPLETLAAEGDLMAYRHSGFWHAMDTLRDKRALEARWASGDAPWRVWK